MKGLAISILIFMCATLIWVEGQSSSSSNLSFRTCFQSALFGFRNASIADIDLISAISSGRIDKHKMSSTSKIPTELPSRASQLEPEVAANVSEVDSGSSLLNSIESEVHQIIGGAMRATPKENIRYLLFTSKNKEQFQVMAEDGSIKGTNWDPKKKTKVLVHGLTSTLWLSPIRNIWTQHIFEIKDAYLNRKQEPGYNVVVVDWTSLSTVPLSRYPEAARGTQDAGEDLAQFLVKLRRANNIHSWDDVHILGHSLGAHVAGVTGNRIQKVRKGNMLARITGLDPAGLCFDSATGLIENPSQMLDFSDAKFVDIVHTNMGNVVRSVAGRYGSSMQTGHADFYPNGGEVQGGCNFMEDRLLYCSHQKSVVFYAQSINEKIMTCPCNDWDSYRSQDCECNLKSGGQFFGEFADPASRGKYFLSIKST